MRERYILESDADVIAGSVAGLDLAGLDPEQAAETLTRHLQRTDNDRHLRQRHRPDGAAAGFDSAEHEARYAAEARRFAGGIRQVRMLDGGVGLLQIAPYLSPPQLAEPYIRAAFTLLASVEALVIDLREGRGGIPETVALICAYRHPAPSSATTSTGTGQRRSAHAGSQRPRWPGSS